MIENFIDPLQEYPKQNSFPPYKQGNKTLTYLHVLKIQERRIECKDLCSSGTEASWKSPEFSGFLMAEYPSASHPFKNRTAVTHVSSRND